MKGKQEGAINEQPPSKNLNKALSPTCKLFYFKIQNGGKKVKLNHIIQQACPTSSLFPLLFFLFSFTLFNPISPQRISPQNLLKFAFEWALLTQWEYSLEQRSFRKT